MSIKKFVLFPYGLAYLLILQQEAVVAEVGAYHLEHAVRHAVSNAGALLHGEENVAVDADAQGAGRNLLQGFFDASAAAADVVGVDSERK